MSLYQAQIAATRFEQVRKLANRFLFDFYDQIRDLPGSTAAREMVVATALEYLDSLSKDARNDPDLQWELAKAYERVGEVQGDPGGPSLGQTKAAHESYKKSAAMQQELVDRGFADTSRRESLSQAYARVMVTARLVGTPEEALRAAERAVEHARAVSEEFAAGARVSLMMVQLDMGEPLKSMETGQAIVSTLLPLSQADVSWTRARQILARAYLKIGRSAHRAARFEEAADAYQQAIRLREQRLVEPVLDTTNARDLVLAYHGAGDMLGADDRFSLGRPQEAEVFYRKALDLAERLAATDSKNATARMELVRSIGKWVGGRRSDQPGRGAATVSSRARSGRVGAARRAGSPGLAWLRLQFDRIGCRSPRPASRGAREPRAVAGDLGRPPRGSPQFAAALSDIADIAIEFADLDRDDPHAAIPHYRRSLAAADQAAALLPKDFAVAFRQVVALEGLTRQLEKTGQAGEASALGQRLVELWTKWNSLQPGSAFIQRRLQEAQKTVGR